MQNSTINKLRAGVLGANDGIISISVILISVVGVLEYHKVLLVGLAALLGGALSMAIGEYVSVSAQKDAEKSADLEELTSPIQASVYSFVSFAVGAGIPLGAVAIAPHVVTAIVGVIVALLITAFVSAYVAKGSLKLALLRNLGGGIIALVLGVILNIGFSV